MSMRQTKYSLENALRDLQESTGNGILVTQPRNYTKDEMGEILIATGGDFPTSGYTLKKKYIGANVWQIWGVKDVE